MGQCVFEAFPFRLELGVFLERFLIGPDTSGRAVFSAVYLYVIDGNSHPMAQRHPPTPHFLDRNRIALRFSTPVVFWLIPEDQSYFVGDLHT